jgi:murein DD-endopeptidase MepM/ murein hydrolase activator NlpD
VGGRRSRLGYGQLILAVGDGLVVDAIDGIPDQDPDDFVPVGANEADGNFVILRLAPRTFAGYAHMIPGTVRVERGDRVRKGDVLGFLGNSGNSDGPHLHFQAASTPPRPGGRGLESQP